MKLLTCYYGKLPKSSRIVSASCQETDKGSMFIRRANMTLHDVQVKKIIVAAVDHIIILFFLKEKEAK